MRFVVNRMPIEEMENNAREIYFFINKEWGLTEDGGTYFPFFSDLMQ